MYGLLLVELRKFVVSRLGDQGWERVCEEAGLARPTWQAYGSYPDEPLPALVEAAAAPTGRNKDRLLEDFGEFIAPDLMRVYRSLIDPAWTALDLIENAGTTIHRAVRMKTPTAEPPELKCVRTSPRIVVLNYTSQRRLCAFAKGIVRGVGAHYHERLTIS